MIAPRLSWNDKLAVEWLSAHKISYSVPPVSQQITTIPINRRAISPFGYNPSLIYHQSRFLLAYRWHSTGSLGTSLAIAHLDPQFNVLKNAQISVAGGSIEDPRFFTHRKQLMLSYVESNYPKSLTCCVRYGSLNCSTWNLEGQYLPRYGRNDGQHTEKNFIFFDHKNSLMCIYASSPEQIVLEIEGSEVKAEHRSPGLSWAWGTQRGGSIPIRYKDGMLKIFHSSLDNEPAPNRRRYYVGAVLMEPEPPFRQVAISKSPVVRGSEVDDLSATERANCVQYKPQVAFPGSAMAVRDGFLVAVGINDSQCSLLHVKEADLHL